MSRAHRCLVILETILQIDLVVIFISISHLKATNKSLYDCVLVLQQRACVAGDDYS